MAKRFEKYQIDFLEAAFEESQHFTKEKTIYLRRVTGLDMEKIASWFSRKRAWKRAKESRGNLIICFIMAIFKKVTLDDYGTILEYINRSREAELEEENQPLKRQLTIIEGRGGDLQFDAIISSINGYL
ncbi:hypothetical protein CDL12_01732 [Handroanthus impetiginosus]|uniref:Homeobox domain-containing protein n=1 Tax=Handroanthus impetiginosus TaxID=429701 RepID=A0A2G9I701_9LAMI|nr:hypothetical protein CDL12_01732 [Handroanthus impetiginosus]